TDGGLTWTRGLIPHLTTASGGTYTRASDPVAAFDAVGSIYINALVGADDAFAGRDIVVSRSTDGGATFDAPRIAYHKSDNTINPDKNWIAVNSFPGTPSAGRLLVTFTAFAPDGYNTIVRTYSDDGGATWSPIANVSAPHISAQSSQPAFLSNGHAAVSYYRVEGNYEDVWLEIALSSDGGVTFGTPFRFVTVLPSYSHPTIRNSYASPSMVADRSGHLFVTYQNWVAGVGPKIFFSRSNDGGANWTTPMVISDNPTFSGVLNACLAASPDGETITVAFYDNRNNPGIDTMVDVYLAQSLDGGASWQPNIRLTPISTDATLAPKTGLGYMLGDYLAIAEATSANVPAVPIWVDTRSGNPDPFIARVGIAPQLDYSSWEAARLSLAQINNPALGGKLGNADFDAKRNLLEYALGSSPADPDTSGLTIGGVDGNTFTVTYPKLKGASDVSLHATASTNLTLGDWTSADVTEMKIGDQGVLEIWRASIPSPVAWPTRFLRLDASSP
ncbi:MAG TPA: sialidase family protein, partial [Chthoniobacterales bacterium]